MPTPQRGVAYTFAIALFDVANPGRLKTTPTLTAGDFTLAKDGGALANLATLPSETPAGSGLVLVRLSATEMTADKVSVKWSDPDFEWGDGHYGFDAPVSTLDNLATAVKNALADALLQRDWTAVTGEAARSLLNACRFLRNKWMVVGQTLSVTKEDDTTVVWQAALTTDGAALPVTSSDPA
jgi:hypothetical protein